MKKRTLGLVLALALLATLGWAVAAYGSAPSDTQAPEAGAAAAADNGAILIDHTCTDLSRVSDHWLEQAKTLAVHYAHTSHGSQINSGLLALEQRDPKYDYSVFPAGAAPPASLACDPGALCIYDGNPPETYIEPDDYWSTDGGRDRTRAVATTGLFDYSMWSWCGQQSDNPTSTVQLYLDTLAGFEQEYPGMRFILMTGHTDGGEAVLERNNDMVTQFALDQGMVVFDFADIESYDPDGNYYPDTSDDCSWCYDWCVAHPEDCAGLPSYCAHSHPFNCLRKGQAFWWMMARLAGWSGEEETPPEGEPRKFASTGSAAYSQTVTYTLVVEGLSAPLTATVCLSDEVPAGLSYVPGTLTATSGIPDDAAQPLLRWSGVLSPSPAVTLTYAVTVSDPAPRLVTNTAIFAAPGYQELTRTARVIINGYRLYVPLVARGAAP
jgi:uncharacterized repeat protein (TIGR01451 family)